MTRASRLARWLRFAAVGGLMAACNLALLWLLIDRLRLSLLQACTVSFVLLNFLGYLANKVFTFRRPPRLVGAELLRYYLVMALSLAANLALMQVLVRHLGLHYLLASVIVTVLLAALNFIAHAVFTFGAEPPRDSATPAPLHLLQVSAFFRLHGGGIEVVADELAHRLARQGLHVHWMAGGAAEEVPPASGLDTLVIEAARSFDPLERRLGLPMPIWGPLSLWRLWQRVGRADLVHIHDYLYQPSLAAALFAVLRRRPFVITQHIGQIPLQSPHARRLLEVLNRQLGSRVLALAERCVFVGAPVQQYFESFGRFKTPPILIPNGVDLDRFSPGPARSSVQPVRVLFIGRFVAKKGMLLLQQCMDLPGLHWTFAGGGPLSPVSTELPHVHMAGRLNGADVVAAYRNADLLVLPSTGEGFPLVLQEALACGTPVLVSREVAQAFPRIDARCVFDVELRVADPVQALRAALVSRTADLMALQAARQAARQLALQWSWAHCIDAYRVLYRQAASR